MTPSHILTRHRPASISYEFEQFCVDQFGMGRKRTMR